MPTDFIFLFMIGVHFFMIRVDPSPILFYLYFFIRSESIRVDTCQKMFLCPVPKISHVKTKWCRWASYFGRFTLWNNSRRRASHLDRFTFWNNGRRATQLGRFTLWHYGRLATQLSIDLLCGTTDAELHNSPVNLLCGTTDAELNNPVWCMHQE